MKKLIALLLCASMLCAFAAIPVVETEDDAVISVCEIFDDEDEIYDRPALA